MLAVFYAVDALLRCFLRIGSWVVLVANFSVLAALGYL